MKLQPTTPSFVSVTLLGILVAACSSKSNDNGVGTDTTDQGGQGGANTSQGGAGNGTSTGDTGGRNNAALGGSATGNTSAAAVSGAAARALIPSFRSAHAW